MNAGGGRHRKSWWCAGLYQDEAGRYRFDGKIDAEAFSRAAASLDRNEGPALLHDLYPDSIDVAEHPAVVPDVWCMAEFPASLLDPEEWVSLFEEAGYTEDGEPALRPDTAITVYRGCSPDRRFGMSWTADIERARWFAQRDLGRGIGRVYEATVPPVALLAYIHGSHRGEAEYVVDPSYLDDATVKLVEEPPPATG